MAFDGVSLMLAKYQTTSYQVWRLGAGTDDKGNPKQELSLNATYVGHFQPLSGDKAITNNKDETIVSDRLYGKITDDVQEGDEVRIGTARYKVTFTQDGVGISGFGSHLEIGLSYSGSSQP